MKKSTHCLFFLLCLFMFLVFSGCGGIPAAQGDTSRSAATGTGRATGGQPGWIRSPYSVFNERQYVAAVGYGNDATQAAKSAYANLTAVFGQSIHVDETLTSNYQEMVRSGGAASWTDTTSLQSVIHTEFSLGALLGSQIRERYDERGTWYAVAVMERAIAIPMYTDVINANLIMINNLIAISESEKNSIDGFSRYQFAATVPDINASYGDVLKYLGAAVPAGVSNGTAYRIEAANIVKTIPITVVVRNDNNNRIGSAFAKSLADMGFLSGGNNSRYRVEATLTLEDAPSAQNVFVRYIITANFIDTNGNAVLVPYSINGREGHSSPQNAVNRTLTAAENRIGTEYSALLNDYLSRLLPKK
jgi:hypothetical protein